MTGCVDIAAALDKLAANGSPDQIAAYLAEHGHVGEPTESDRCPVANYVLASTSVPVSVGGYTWSRADVYLDEGRTPREVGAFISRFDGGDYPDLIRKPAPALTPASLVRADLLSPVLRIPDVDSAVVDLDALDAAIDREEC